MLPIWCYESTEKFYVDHWDNTVPQNNLKFIDFFFNWSSNYGAGRRTAFNVASICFLCQVLKIVREMTGLFKSHLKSQYKYVADLMSWTNEDVDHRDNVNHLSCFSDTYNNTVVTSLTIDQAIIGQV